MQLAKAPTTMNAVGAVWRRTKGGKIVEYVVAAYALVIGSLGWYGWHVQRQRRELRDRRDSDRTRETDS